MKLSNFINYTQFMKKEPISFQSSASIGLHLSTDTTHYIRFKNKDQIKISFTQIRKHTLYALCT